MLGIMKRLCAVGLVAVSALGQAAVAAEKITYLFPAPEFLPAFAPYQLAKARGYYRDAGLDVVFQVGKGGADVAKQVGVGNADMGGGAIDTVMVVRTNGVPIKAVGVLGTGTHYQLIFRKAANIGGPADLKGKTIGVIGFQDSGYYNLQGVLSTVGLKRDDATIQAVGIAGITQLMVSGDVDAVVATPEFGIMIEGASVPVDMMPITQYFPGLAQIILASEKAVAERPELIGKFVGATVRAVEDIVNDPKTMSEEFARIVPQYSDKQPLVQEIMERYKTLVYQGAGGGKIGPIDGDRVQTLADFYGKAGILPADYKVADAYTNVLVAQ